jgi:cyclase
MSKKRLIPKLQLKTSSYNSSKTVLVITKEFDQVIEIGDPVSQSKIYQDQAADELIFINIDRNQKEVNNLCKIIRKVSEEIFMPITVGGGVNCEEDFRSLLSNGADKICINTIAVKNPFFIKSSSEKFGAQCVVVSIDYKKEIDGTYRVYINNGQEKTNLDPLLWAIECEKMGAGEILLTSIDHDGKRQGLNLEISEKISENINIPIINSGGCGIAQHFIDGFLVGKADAVSSGTFFALQDQSFMQTRSQIKNAGVEIRVHT